MEQYEYDPDKHRKVSNCIVGWGCGCIIVSFIVLFICFFSPYWLYDRVQFIDQGLLARCPYGRWACIWIGDENFAWEYSLPGWYRACQGLYGFGIILILASFFLTCLNICCSAVFTETSTISLITFLMLIISCAMVTLAIGLFGGYASVQMYAGYNNINLFNWGFYLSMFGDFMAFLAAFLFLIEGCRERHQLRKFGQPYMFI